MSGFWRCKVLILHITELRKELETTWDKAGDLEHGNVTAWPHSSLWELANKGNEINALISRADLPGEKSQIAATKLNIPEEVNRTSLSLYDPWDPHSAYDHIWGNTAPAVVLLAGTTVAWVWEREEQLLEQ